MLLQNPDYKQTVIIGGGTAGWLTALCMSKLRNHGSQIWLIESKEVPNVGAGEGTTPHIIFLLRFLGVSLDEFYEKTLATKKYGVEFENWSGEGESFKHYFIGNKGNDYAYHFDSQKIIQFLKEKALKANVKYIQDDYVGCFKENENITSIELKENGILSTDFVFDCSGFGRLLIGKEYNTKWIDCGKYLPIKAALPFTMERTEKEERKDVTFTRAVALEHGWLWMIPLQTRWGCGYCHDSDLVSEEEARQEVEYYLNRKVFSRFSRGRIQFNTGYYEKLFVGNCMAVGLSGGFFEPLEATSIMISCMQLMFFVRAQGYDIDHKKFNSTMLKVNEQTLAFLFYHYISKKEDTKLWRSFDKRPIPKLLKKLIHPNGSLKNITKSQYKKILQADEIWELVFHIDSWKTFSKNLIDNHTDYTHNLYSESLWGSLKEKLGF